MHTSQLFGDAQLLVNLDLWVENGYLVDLVRRAAAEGVETWVTADRGNIKCLECEWISDGGIEMVLDRALTPDMLDAALRMATEHADAPDARQLLSVTLRDLTTPKQAENKTRKVLTWVWVVLRDNARAMIRSEIEHQHEVVDRVLHREALLATFPLFGSIAAAVGRQVQLKSVGGREVAPAARPVDVRGARVHRCGRSPYPLIGLHAENGTAVTALKVPGT